MTRVDLFFFFIFQIHSFGRGRNGCWPCVRNQSLHTPARERGEGKKKKRTTQMRPMKRDRLDQQLVQGGSEGKPFHQVLEIQAAGS